MANLPGSLQYLNDIEVAGDNPVTEAVINKVGGSLNALVALAQGMQVFTADGNFTVPANVTRIFVFACGGGGGGFGAASAGATGGGGGGGAIPVLVPYVVTPAAIHAVVIGAGGPGGTAANGTVGSNTTFGGTLLIFEGAPPGTAIVGTTPVASWRGRGPYSGGGFQVEGDNSLWASGGARGSSGTATQKGGGGGASLGAGGAGGATAANGTSAAANSGAGGGGSGNGGGANRTGGTGGSGYMIIIW